MPDYPTVSRTKDHFQDQLLQDYPEIVSIAPRLKLDDNGHPTNEAVIVIGVKMRNPLRLGPGADAQAQMVPIPTKLPVIDTQGARVPGETVDIIIEEEGEILPQMHTTKRRPCPGGYSIGHLRVTAGTLGSIARIDSAWEYILSNNHVLAATNSGAAGDPIYQPGVADGGGPPDLIGHLNNFIPLNFSGGTNEVDCAVAKACDPWSQCIMRNVWGIGIPRAVANATVGQSIRKSGRTTQITNGTIMSDNATIRFSYGAGLVAVFVNQLQYTHMTQGGDSGSLVWDRDSLTVVGLHFAGSGTASYGNKIQRVLSLLQVALT